MQGRLSDAEERKLGLGGQPSGGPVTRYPAGAHHLSVLAAYPEAESGTDTGPPLFAAYGCAIHPGSVAYNNAARCPRMNRWVYRESAKTGSAILPRRAGAESPPYL